MGLTALFQACRGRCYGALSYPAISDIIAMLGGHRLPGVVP